MNLREINILEEIHFHYLQKQEEIQNFDLDLDM